MTETIIFVCFLVGTTVIIVLLAVWLIKRKYFGKELEDEQPMGEFAVLNSKVQPEQDFVVLKYGKDTIQLSPAEYVLWRTKDRKGKRQFVRNLKKILKSQAPPEGSAQ